MRPMAPEESRPAPPAVRRPAPPRITVVETVYHQRPGRGPTAVDSRYSRATVRDEQVYERELVAVEEWAPLDCGWVESAGMLVIKNIEASPLATRDIPDEAAREAASWLTLEVGVSCGAGVAAFGLVPPGETARWVPTGNLRVRSRRGAVRYTAHVFPG